LRSELLQRLDTASPREWRSLLWSSHFVELDPKIVAQTRLLLAGHYEKITPPPRSPSTQLRLPVDRRWTIATDAFPLLETPTLYVASSAIGVSVHSRETGEKIWSRELPFLADVAFPYFDSALVAGTDGVARLSLADGEILWQIQIPPQESELFRTDDSILPSREWSSFRLAGTKLIARFGNDRLVAIDVETGLLAWSIATRPKSLGVIGIRPQLQATAKFVFLQLTNGERWTLNANTGEILHQHESMRVSWLQPAIVVDDQTVIFANDSEHVERFDLKTNKAIWTHEIEDDPSLTGRCPELRRIGDLLFVCIERNFGYELDCLSANTSQRKWQKPIFLGRERIDLFRCDLLDQQLFVPIESRLVSISLDTGLKRWEVPIPDAQPHERWSVRATRTALFVYPDSSRAVSQSIVDRRESRIPRAIYLLRSLSREYDEFVNREFSVWVLGVTDGEPIQRMRFPASGYRVQFHLRGNSAIVAVGGRWWSLK